MGIISKPIILLTFAISKELTVFQLKLQHNSSNFFLIASMFLKYDKISHKLLFLTESIYMYEL